MCVTCGSKTNLHFPPVWFLTCHSKAINSQREALCNLIWNLMLERPTGRRMERELSQLRRSNREPEAHYLNHGLLHSTRSEKRISFVKSFSFILSVKYSKHLPQLLIKCHWTEGKGKLCMSRKLEDK